MTRGSLSKNLLVQSPRSWARPLSLLGMTTPNKMLHRSEESASVSLPELLKTSDVTPLPPMSLSKSRKCALVIVFCLAQFMDAFNISSVIPAIPAISHDLSMKPNESTWLFAAYSATFAAFLLLVSSVYVQSKKLGLLIFFAEWPDK